MHRRRPILILAALPLLSGALLGGILLQGPSLAAPPHTVPPLPPPPQDATDRHATDRHVADGTDVQVTTFWHSERAQGYHAKVCASIGDAAVRSLPRIAGVPPRAKDAPLLPIVIHESPAAFRRAQAGAAGSDSGTKNDRPKRIRKPKADAPPGEPTAPVPISLRADPAQGGTLLANAPRVDDRPMFATGIQPVARWGVAIEAAHAGLFGAQDLDAATRDGAALLAAHAGLAEIGFAPAELHLAPYVSTGLCDLRDRLGDLAGHERRDALRLIAAEPPSDHLLYSVNGPFAASAAEAARSLLHLGSLRGAAAPSVDQAGPDRAGPDPAAWAVRYLTENAPAWRIEAGSVCAHPFGWHVVAPRRSDALVLSADPMGERPFTLRTSFVQFANSLGDAAQADLVLGDVNGDRYLLACNTMHGIYLFRRAGPDQPYETVTEFKEVPMPAGTPIDVVVRWDGKDLVISVRGAALPKQRLEPGAMSGRFGFGAHAGVSALFSEIIVE